MTFSVGITRDMRGPDGRIPHGEKGLRALSEAGISWRFLDRDDAEVSPVDAGSFDALIVGAARVTRATLGCAPRLALVARTGVGLDAVDLEACRDSGVLVTVTKDAVRGPMAEAALALVLALTHNLTLKDALVREGRWGEGPAHVGLGLAGRTLGLVGFGGIGREIARLALPFGVDVLAWTPRLTEDMAAAGGARRVDLDTLLELSDVVCLACPLTPETHHLIDRRRIGLMRQSSFLVNIARGPVVDQVALADALRAGDIRGAGLDVFEQEPLPLDDPLLELDNVILAPHALGHVQRMLTDIYASACEAVIAVAEGRVPRELVD